MTTRQDNLETSPVPPDNDNSRLRQLERDTAMRAAQHKQADKQTRLREDSRTDTDLDPPSSSSDDSGSEGRLVIASSEFEEEDKEANGATTRPREEGSATCHQSTTEKLPEGFREVRHKKNRRTPRKPRNLPAKAGPSSEGGSMYTVPTRNSFEHLAEEPSNQQTLGPQAMDTMATPGPAQKKLRPPPLVVYHTKNYLQLNKALKEHLSGELRAVYRGDHIKYTFDTMEDYRQASLFAEQNNLHYYTHQSPEDRGFKVVIKDLPPEVTAPEVEDELCRKGFDVQNTHQYKKREENSRKLRPLPVFTVTLPKGKDSDKIWTIRYLFDTKVRVENYEPKKGPAQCKNCQRLDHTTKYCHLPPRCVKCGGPHRTAECTLRPEEKATCLFCKGAHPASWRGCPHHQEAMKKLKSRRRTQAPSQRKSTAATKTVTPTSAQELPTPSPQTSGDRQWPPLGTTTARTFADAVNGRQQSAQPAIGTSLSDALREISALLASFLNARNVGIIIATANRLKQTTDTTQKILTLMEGIAQLFD